MTDPDRLKLAAIDEEDLAVISAHVQDAVLKVGDMVYLPKERRFALAMNRFTWEKAKTAPPRLRAPPRRADLRPRQRGARRSGIDRDRPDAVLELLAVSFEPTDAPAGHVTLVFAGGAAVAARRRGHRGAPRRPRRRLGDKGQAQPRHRRRRDETGA